MQLHLQTPSFLSSINSNILGSIGLFMRYCNLAGNKQIISNYIKLNYLSFFVTSSVWCFAIKFWGALKNSTWSNASLGASQLMGGASASSLSSSQWSITDLDCSLSSPFLKSGINHIDEYFAIPIHYWADQSGWVLHRVSFLSWIYQIW